MNIHWRRTLQTFAFMRKEISDAFHQPRLLIALVLGPFLIMAIFGMGYRNSVPPLKTFVVIPENSPFTDQAETYADQLKSYVRVVAVSSDMGAAQKELRDGNVDVVVGFPDAPMQTLVEGQHPKITIMHTRLDPIERTSISFASELAVDKINGAVLAQVIAEGQRAASPVDTALAAAGASVQRLADAVRNGDTAGVDAALAELDTEGSAISTQGSAIRSLLRMDTGTDNTARSEQLSKQLDEFTSTLDAARQQSQSLDQATVDRLGQTLDGIRTNVEGLADVDPNVLSQPFEPDVQLYAPQVGQVTDWYAPAAIIVILQQFGLAFGALTFVRERQLAIAEVLKVSPVTAGPSLVGRYLAYVVLGAIVGAVLTTLIVTTLNVPIVGDLASIAMVMALTLVASIGLGLVVSLVSSTDGQAVQYALLVLLASLFFSGFFLSVGQLRGPALVVGWMLPATYGMQMLRDLMLRGTQPHLLLVAGLAGYGALMFLLALVGARRRMNAGTV
ncbi:MAG TPA: ABC transporter permease [Ilumatobacteraceae bacterium]|nr:ABC transporter permease [Ilumatobacteraceae bacterium]